MKRIVASLGIGLAITIIFSQFDIVKYDYKQYTDLHENVLRLHVVANSDCNSDQEVKLEVKDKIVEMSSELFSNSQTIEQTKQIAQDSITQLTNVANGVIVENGYDYPVNISVKKLDFPTKQYDGFTMPSGVYTSLHVELGQAQGKNWWCVLYPSMCIPTAVQMGDSSTGNCVDEKFSDKQEDMLKQPKKYKVKFALFEIYEMIMGKKNGLPQYKN